MDPPLGPSERAPCRAPNPADGSVRFINETVQINVYLRVTNGKELV